MSVDEHTIELAGSPVFYRRAPGPDVPVVYLHGIPTSSDDWTPLLERTGGIAPDLIGFGRSGKGGHLDYSIDAHARFVEQLLDQLEIDRIKLVVHDWGAAAGLAFAQRHPGRVRRLVIFNAVPLFGEFEWPPLVRRLQRPLLGELIMGSTTRGLLAHTLRKGGNWPDQAIANVWHQFDHGTQRAILRLYRRATPQRLAEAGSDIRKLDMPALVLWGELDPWLHPRLSETFSNRLPRATAIRLKDAAHWPWLDAPEAVDRAVDFLSGT